MTEPRPHYPASQAEIEAAVEWAIEEGEPIDPVITNLIYPDGAPRMWANWTEDAERIYFEACRLFTARRAQPRAIHIDPQQAWLAILASHDMPVERRLTWEDMADRLKVPIRTAQYQILNVLGFVFAGRPGHRRRLVAGPCSKCSRILEVTVIVDLMCPECGGT